MIAASDAQSYIDAARNPSLPAATRRKALRLAELWCTYQDVWDASRGTKRADDPDVRARMSELSAAVDRLHAEMSRPDYGEATGSRKVGIDDDAMAVKGVPRGENAAVMLAPGEKVADFVADRSGVKTRDIEWHFGRLGAQVKAHMGWTADLDKFRVADEKTMTVGGTSVLVPATTAAQLIDLMRSQTHVIGMGARTIPMIGHTVKIPRLTADPSPTWLSEGSVIPESEATFDSVDLVAKRLASLTRTTQELTEDSDPVEVGGTLSRSLTRTFAQELDRVALRGSGTDPEPRGIRNTSGVSLVDLGGTASADWLTLVNLNRDVANSNAVNTGYLTSPRTLTAVESEKDANGNFVQPPAIVADIPRRSTTQVPTNLGDGDESEVYSGQWSQLIVATRVAFELRILQELFAVNGEVGYAARLRGDVNAAHGESFAIAVGVGN